MRPRFYIPWEFILYGKIEQAGTIAGIVKTAVDIFVTLEERRKKKDIESRVAQLEAELAKLREGK